MLKFRLLLRVKGNIQPENNFVPKKFREFKETRDLFKKIRDTKRTFHTKMGTINDRNIMDLIEAEDIKRWQQYTEELHKKRSSCPRNFDGVITHLEPGILEY